MIAICLPPYVRPTPASLIQSRFRASEGIKEGRRTHGIVQVGEALCSQVATKSGSVKAGMLTERGHHRLPQQIKRLERELNLAQGFAELLEQLGMVQHGRQKHSFPPFTGGARP